MHESGVASNLRSRESYWRLRLSRPEGDPSELAWSSDLASRSASAKHGVVGCSAQAYSQNPSPIRSAILAVFLAFEYRQLSGTLYRRNRQLCWFFLITCLCVMKVLQNSYRPIDMRMQYMYVYIYIYIVI